MMNDTVTIRFQEALTIYRHRVEHTLTNALTHCDQASQLQAAMRYSTLNAGKRLRPILVYATGACFTDLLEKCDHAAAAVECIHCHSLIHDDLPAMDDDTLRRGKPTCHIAFDEATAILAGDALQSLAFTLLATIPVNLVAPDAILQMTHTLATSSGAPGMVGGQALDLSAEGKKITESELMKIHRLKTGALIRASVRLGALAGGCVDAETLSTLDIFANALGLAFQLQDDLLDVIGNEKQMGKHTGQDRKHDKATVTHLLGIEITQQRIQTLTNQAIHALKSLPEDTRTLEMLCAYLMKRDY